MFKPLSLFCILGLVFAAVGCKNRSGGEAIAESGLSESAAKPNYNGTECFFGSSMNGISRMNYLQMGFKTELKASSNGADPLKTASKWVPAALADGMSQITGNAYTKANALAAIRDADDKTIWYQNIVNYIDENSFKIAPIAPGERIRTSFFQFQVSLGDNWNGFVVQVDYAKDSVVLGHKIVAKYGDGDTYDCAIKRPTKEQRITSALAPRYCAFGEDTGYLYSSLTRKNGVWRPNGKDANLNAKSKLTAQQEKDIVGGMGDFMEPGETALDAIAKADEENMDLREIKYTKNGKIYRWYSFYSGDTPVGFIYGVGSNGKDGIVATVGDGDVSDCKVKRQKN